MIPGFLVGVRNKPADGLRRIDLSSFLIKSITSKYRNLNKKSSLEIRFFFFTFQLNWTQNKSNQMSFTDNYT